MKKLFVVLFLALVFVSSACAGDLAAAKSAGVLSFGVSTDKAPFVFYDSNDDLTGIDIELMKEIANRLGLELDVTAMSSNDLAESLTIGQVDVIGGAYSKTSARTATMDFTNVYYIGEAVFVSLSGQKLPTPLEASSFSGKKVGVLKNSGFEDWLRTELYGGGHILKKDIYTYDKTEDMIRALDKAKVDLILIDYSLFQSQLMNRGDYVSYNYGSAKDSYAFGLRKGSDLKTEINSNLVAMLKDGTAQQIADKFFNMDYAETPAVIQWNQKTKASATPTAAPAATATANAPLVFPVAPTVAPTAIPAQTNCSYSMAYVADLTIPDGQPISAGSAFTKSWRIKNTGNCAWGTNFIWAFASGAQMSGSNRYVPKVVNPGETVDISVDLVAPTAPGSYQGYWQLKTPQGYNIGPSIWVQIIVPGTYNAPTTAPYYPTSTPAPGYSHPTPTPWYYICDENCQLETLVAMLPTATSVFDGPTWIDSEKNWMKTAIAAPLPTATPQWEIWSPGHKIYATATIDWGTVVDIGHTIDLDSINWSDIMPIKEK